MRFLNQDDLKKYDEFRAKGFKLNPPEESGRILKTLFKGLKPILFAGAIMYGINYVF